MTRTRRPILAVDVDGVLNAISRGEPPEGWRDTRALGFRIRYNPGHGTKLLVAAEETGAELVWCTTWESQANDCIGALLGLPELPWVPMEPGRAGLKFSEYRPFGVVKAIAMCTYAAGRPFCWLDDEPDAADALRSCPAPHLVVQVAEHTGLQDKHLERARTWLREHVQPGGGDDD